MGNYIGIDYGSIGQVSVIGWRMVGGIITAKGRKISGYTQLALSDGRYLTYPENVAIGPALDLAQLEHGIDVSDERERLNNWIKTGNGAKFSLR